MINDALFLPYGTAEKGQFAQGPGHETLIPREHAQQLLGTEVIPFRGRCITIRRHDGSQVGAAGSENISDTVETVSEMERKRVVS